jgi:hypothetical protein
VVGTAVVGTTSGSVTVGIGKDVDDDGVAADGIQPEMKIIPKII